MARRQVTLGGTERKRAGAWEVDQSGWSTKRLFHRATRVCESLEGFLNQIFRVWKYHCSTSSGWSLAPTANRNFNLNRLSIFTTPLQYRSLQHHRKQSNVSTQAADTHVCKGPRSYNTQKKFAARRPENSSAHHRRSYRKPSVGMAAHHFHHCLRNIHAPSRGVAPNCACDRINSNLLKPSLDEDYFQTQRSDPEALRSRPRQQNRENCIVWLGLLSLALLVVATVYVLSCYDLKISPASEYMAVTQM